MKVMVAVMDKLRLWGSTSICLLMLCLAANVDSGEINVPYGGSISGFGPDYYRGQTFIALPGVANDLTIYVGDSNPLPGPVTYHVLITEVDTTSGIHPTNVLFEYLSSYSLFFRNSCSTLYTQMATLFLPFISSVNVRLLQFDVIYLMHYFA